MLDFLGNSGRHTLVHAGDVLGGDMSEPAKKRYKKSSEKKGVPEEIDVLAELDHAEIEQKKAEEAKRRLHVVGKAKFSSQDIDPFEALGIVPKSVPHWQRRIPASDRQRGVLERSGLKLPKDLDTGRASQLIEVLMSKATDKQAWVLRKAGIDPAGLDRKKASAVIDMIKKGDTESAKKIAAAR